MGQGFGAEFYMKLDTEKVEAMVAKPLAGFLCFVGRIRSGLMGTFAREYNWTKSFLNLRM